MRAFLGSGAYRRTAGYGGYLPCVLSLALAIEFCAFSGMAQAGLFDSKLYSGCTATGGDPDGCTCAEQVIHETFDAAYIPIIETQLRGELKAKNTQLEELGLIGRSKFAAEMYQFAGSGVYQCSGVKLFIFKVSETMPW